MLNDLVLLQGADADDDAESYIDRYVSTSDEADELIKEYWQNIEHIGREDAAYTARRTPGVYEGLSPKGRAFVDREDITA